MVKLFAKFEVAEQETLADILKTMEADKAEGALQAPNSTGWVRASQSNELYLFLDRALAEADFQRYFKVPAAQSTRC
jgi:hypothetical protein